MKRIIVFLAVVITCSFFVSCAVSKPVMNTDCAVLSQPNFRIVGHSDGETKAFYFLGIGGNSKTAQADVAMKNMKANVKLLPNQAYTNVMTTHTLGFYLIAWTIKTKVSADIVEFYDAASLKVAQENELNKIKAAEEECSKFEKRESVFMNHHYTWEAHNSNTVTINSIEIEDNSSVINLVDPNRLYAGKKICLLYKGGRRVSCTTSFNEKKLLTSIYVPCQIEYLFSVEVEGETQLSLRNIFDY